MINNFSQFFVHSDWLTCQWTNYDLSDEGFPPRKSFLQIKKLLFWTNISVKYFGPIFRSNMLGYVGSKMKSVEISFRTDP